MRRLFVVLCLVLVWSQPVVAQSESVLRIRIEWVPQQPDADLEVAQEVIERRINGLGLAESSVEIDNERLVAIYEAPMDFAVALDFSQQLIALIQPVALLEFVDLSSMAATEIEKLVGGCIWTTAQAERGLASKDCLSQLGETPFPTVITGNDLVDAQAYADNLGRWQISFQIADEAVSEFEAHTEAHIGDALAIVLDGEVLSAPTIQGKLSGYGVISGDFTMEAANALAVQLRSGSLPVELMVQSVIIVRIQ